MTHLRHTFLGRVRQWLTELAHLFGREKADFVGTAPTDHNSVLAPRPTRMNLARRKAVAHVFPAPRPGTRSANVVDVRIAGLTRTKPVVSSR